MFLYFASTAILALIVYICEMYVLSILSSVTYVILSGFSGIIVIAFAALMLNYTFNMISWIGYGVSIFAIILYGIGKYKHEHQIRARSKKQNQHFPLHISSHSMNYHNNNEEYWLKNNDMQHMFMTPDEYDMQNNMNYNHNYNDNPYQNQSVNGKKKKKKSSNKIWHHQPINPDPMLMNPIDPDDATYVNTGQDVYLDMSRDEVGSISITNERL